MKENSILNKLFKNLGDRMDGRRFFIFRADEAIGRLKHVIIRGTSGY